MSFSNSFAALGEDSGHILPTNGDLQQAAMASDPGLVPTTANALSMESSPTNASQGAPVAPDGGDMEVDVFVPETQMTPRKPGGTSQSSSRASTAPFGPRPAPSPMHEPGRRKRDEEDSPSVLARVAKRSFGAIGAINKAADQRRRPITTEDLSEAALDRLQPTAPRATMTLTLEEIALVLKARDAADAGGQQRSWSKGPPPEAASTSHVGQEVEDDQDDPFLSATSTTFKLRAAAAKEGGTLGDDEGEAPASPSPPSRHRKNKPRAPTQESTAGNPVNEKSLAESYDAALEALKAAKVRRHGNAPEDPMELSDTSSEDEPLAPTLNVADFDQTSSLTAGGAGEGIPRHFMAPQASREQQRQAGGISPLLSETGVEIKAIGRMTPVVGASYNEHLQGIGPKQKAYLSKIDTIVVPLRPTRVAGQPAYTIDMDILVAIVIWYLRAVFRKKYPNMKPRIIPGYREKGRPDDPNVLPCIMFAYNMPDEVALTIQGARGWILGLLSMIAYRDIEERSPFLATLQGFHTDNTELVKIAFVNAFKLNPAVCETVARAAAERDYDAGALMKDLASRIKVLPYETVKPKSHGLVILQFHIFLESKVSNETHAQLKRDALTIEIEDPAVGQNTIFFPWTCDECYQATHPGGMCPLLLLSRGTTVERELAAAIARNAERPAERANTRAVKDGQSAHNKSDHAQSAQGKPDRAQPKGDHKKKGDKKDHQGKPQRF